MNKTSNTAVAWSNLQMLSYFEVTASAAVEAIAMIYQMGTETDK